MDSKFKNDTENLWFNLRILVKELREGFAAILAIDEYYLINPPEKYENLFIQRAQAAIEVQIFLELVKLFDRAYTGKHANNSINKLKEELSILEGHEKSVIKIEELCYLYNELMPKRIRDKKIAHHDLRDLNSLEGWDVKLTELGVLLENMDTCLQDIGRVLTNLTFPIEPIKYPTERYLQSILDINLNDGQDRM